MLEFLQSLFHVRPDNDAGRRGERLAADWLRRERRFTIVARNWRNPRDRREEIDLVGRDGEALVFIEVKARAADALVPGYHAIDERKKRVLRRAIESYLGQLTEKPNTFRFDVVEVSFSGPTAPPATGLNGPVAAPARPVELTPEILHFENVPLFSKYFRG